MLLEKLGLLLVLCLNNKLIISLNITLIRLSLRTIPAFNLDLLRRNIRLINKFTILNNTHCFLYFIIKIDCEICSSIWWFDSSIT
jgi:hypothetical protein